MAFQTGTSKKDPDDSPHATGAGQKGNMPVRQLLRQAANIRSLKRKVEESEQKLVEASLHSDLTNLQTDESMALIGIYVLSKENELADRKNPEVSLSELRLRAQTDREYRRIYNGNFPITLKLLEDLMLVTSRSEAGDTFITLTEDGKKVAGPTYLRLRNTKGSMRRHGQ